MRVPKKYAVVTSTQPPTTPTPAPYFEILTPIHKAHALDHTFWKPRCLRNRWPTSDDAAKREAVPWLIVP